MSAKNPALGRIINFWNRYLSGFYVAFIGYGNRVLILGIPLKPATTNLQTVTI